MSRLLVLVILFLFQSAAAAAERPNILWISSEDNGPHLGCYGDPDANTPNLDALAARSAIYLDCWSVCPVCAPARTAIITGMYPSSLGAEHMRSMVRVPAELKLWPQLLREAGYYCTNNVKEDYNVEKPGQVWDVSSAKAHWKNRKPGQPFFAVFNFTTTHESQVRKRPHKFVHDPAKVRVPGYHPDLPEAREAWAQYHDQMTEMDAQAGGILDELKDAGLDQETIVFYWGDHGPGLPRCKRSPCNSGLRVPLIVHIPEKFRDLAPADYAAGAKLDRMVEFVDFGPTVLSLAGVEAPAIQQGRAFLGKYSSNARDYLHGLRGRMDERYDCIRSVRDKRYVYVRNFLPQLPAGQHNAYMFVTPLTVAWRKAFDAGALPPEHARFFEPRQAEELYDLEADPAEVKNLAAEPSHAGTLARLRAECTVWMTQIRDVGILPEADMLRRAGPRTCYELGHDPKLPFGEILKAADQASREADFEVLVQLLKSPDSAVRYWGAIGFSVRGKPIADDAAVVLEGLLSDESPSVRVAAADALATFGPNSLNEVGIAALLREADAGKNSYYGAVAALNALDRLDKAIDPIRPDIAKLPRKSPGATQRTAAYVERLIQHILGETPPPE